MSPGEADEACEYLVTLFPTAAAARTAALAERFQPFDLAAVRLCIEAHRATSEFLVEPVLLRLIREQATADAGVRAARALEQSRQYQNRREADAAKADADRARVVAVLSALPADELAARRMATLVKRRGTWPAWMLAKLEFADPLQSRTLGAAMVEDMTAEQAVRT